MGPQSRNPKTTGLCSLPLLEPSSQSPRCHRAALLLEAPGDGPSCSSSSRCPGGPLASARTRCSARVCVSPLTGALVVDSSIQTKPGTLSGGCPSLATLQRPRGPRGPPRALLLSGRRRSWGQAWLRQPEPGPPLGFRARGALCAAAVTRVRAPHGAEDRTVVSEPAPRSPLSGKQQAVGWWGSLSPDPRATTPSPAPRRALERVWGAPGPGSGCSQMGAATLRVRTLTLAFCHFPMSPNTGFSSPAVCKCEDSP